MTAERIRTMPFGKFRGGPIGSLPDDYVDWLLGLDDLRPRLRAALERERRQLEDDREHRPSAEPRPDTTGFMDTVK